MSRFGYWRTQAAAVIDRVHAGLPEGASLAERKAAVDAAYPFGPRQYHPYKMWLKERAAYLSAYGYERRHKPEQESYSQRVARIGGLFD